MKKKRRSRQFKNNSRVIDMHEARLRRIRKRAEQRKEEERRKTAASSRRIKRRRELRRKQNRRRFLLGLVAATMVVIIAFSVVGIVMLKKEQHDIMEKQAQLKEQKRQLEKDLENINSKESIEDQARSKLKLIKPRGNIYSGGLINTDENQRSHCRRGEMIPLQSGTVLMHLQ